jgi:hypothetical protein
MFGAAASIVESVILFGRQSSIILGSASCPASRYVSGRASNNQIVVVKRNPWAFAVAGDGSLR